MGETDSCGAEGAVGAAASSSRPINKEFNALPEPLQRAYQSLYPTVWAFRLPCFQYKFEGDIIDERIASKKAETNKPVSSEYIQQVRESAEPLFHAPTYTSPFQLIFRREAEWRRLVMINAFQYVQDIVAPEDESLLIEPAVNFFLQQAANTIVAFVFGCCSIPQSQPVDDFASLVYQRLAMCAFNKSNFEMLLDGYALVMSTFLNRDNLNSDELQIKQDLPRLMAKMLLQMDWAAEHSQAQTYLSLVIVPLIEQGDPSRQRRVNALQDLRSAFERKQETASEFARILKRYLRHYHGRTMSGDDRVGLLDGIYRKVKLLGSKALDGTVVRTSVAGARESLFGGSAGVGPPDPAADTPSAGSSPG